MNQTKKRLSIINLAISITDIETIQLQLLKLTPLKTDAKIQKILTLLQANNYAQAQQYINEYINEPIDTILQRTSQTSTPNISSEDQKTIDEFNLFINNDTNRHSSKPSEVNIHEYIEKPRIKKAEQSPDYEKLLQLNADDIMAHNIDIDLSKKRHTDDFFTVSEEDEQKDIPLQKDIPKDTFFEDYQDTPSNTSDTVQECQISESETETQNDLKEIHITTKSIPRKYTPIPYIEQKLMHMYRRYPPIQKPNQKSEIVEQFLDKISKEGYTESEIEEMITFIQTLIKQEQYTEAAQLLLISASTESKFAQFSLARELFKGSVLLKDISKSFHLMHTLAQDDYPEALCDIGQFYEYGIGTTKDLVKAESFYKKAVDLGIQRAQKHYKRLNKANKKIF